MRLILFILLIFGLLGWAIYSFTSDDNPTLIGSVAGAVTDTTVEVSKDAGSALYSNDNLKQLSNPLPPIVSTSFTFQYRPIPESAFFDRFRTESSDHSGRQSLLVVPDSASRTVALVGHSDQVGLAKAALRLFDVPNSSCHAKAWVVFVRSDKSDGFDFALSLSGSPANSSFDLRSKSFSGLAAIGNVEASLELMKSRGLVEVVQAPHLQMSNGQKALIETGEEIAVPIVTVNQNVTQTTVEYRKVGLSLELLPQFLADDKIRLQVRQSNGLVGQLRDVGGFEVPELTNQTLTNTIETKVGKVVVLGGVESSQYQRVKGLISSREEKQTGHLYVVLATYSTIPKATPVLESVSSSLLPPVN